MSEFLKLKKSNCKNCYKCIRNCPVKSIRFSGNQAHIVGNECILCGQCFVVCPQNAKEIADDTELVKVLLQSPQPVIASIAPSFIANYNGIGINSIRKALKKLGFTDVEETAIGATIVKTEYEKILDNPSTDILISSSCHSVNLLIQKHFPNSLKYLANVISPMQAHSLDIKRRYPDAKTVFIGPCIAKKDEAMHYEGIVDAVLTFEDLSKWLNRENITLEEERDNINESKTRLFPTTGGIIKTMKQSESITYLAIDGVENCMSALRDIEDGELKNCFIEMSACHQSCIGGPVMEKYHHSPIRDFTNVTKYAGKKDFDTLSLSSDLSVKHLEYIGRKLPMPSEEQIANILKDMGKTLKEHELNCGSCGYNTCKEKAVAIYQGKADLTMCMPFLKDKAESFSDKIIGNTPNAIIVLNDNLEVQQINPAARKLLNINHQSDILGEQVVRILDPLIFLQVKDENKNIKNKRVYLAEYNKYIEQTVLYDINYKIFISIMRDITKDVLENEKKEKMTNQTVEIADKVVERQLRVVQEIASLLGETAAETKIALTKLKESITNE